MTPVVTRLLMKAREDQVGAIGFGECVPNEVEGLLSKVGMTMAEMEAAERVDWRSKELNDADGVVLVRMLEKNTKVAFEWRREGGGIDDHRRVEVC